MAHALKCAKCLGKMKPGFILELGADNGCSVSRWIAGSPEAGWLGTKIHGKDTLDIASYRCESCGYLESYANPA